MEKKTYFAQDKQGNVIPNATVHIYNAGTNVLADTIIALNGSRLKNPFTADADGAIVFSMPDGLYDMVISKGSLNGQRIHFQCLDVTETVAATSAEVERAVAAADRAESVTVLGQPYKTLADAQAAITAGTIADGQLFIVSSPESIYYVDEYKNVGGTPQPTGKHIPNATYVTEARQKADRVDSRTNGIQSTEVSKYLLDILSKNGFLMLGIDDKGVVLVDKLDAKKTITAPGMTVNEAITLAASRLTPLMHPGFLYVETDLEGRIVFGTRADFTKEYQGMPLVTDRGLLRNSLFFIGDSITANGSDPSYAPCLNSLSWACWAALGTNSRVRYEGQSATGGFTTAQILATHLPKAIAAKPTFCTVLGGRNDIVQAIPVATTIANFKSMFLQLRKAGIIPVICTMSAQSDNSDARRIMEHTLNAWLRAYARKHRLPLVDFHATTVNPLNGNWLPGYNADVSHPLALGAKVMGKTFADAMTPWLAPILPQMADEQLTPAVTQNMIDNPLFLNHDGITPTGWVVETAGGSVVEADSSIKGNAWRLTGTGSGVGPKVSKTITVTPGQKLGFGFKFKSTSNNRVETFLLAGASNSTINLAGIRRWSAPTDDWGYYFSECVVPAGVTQVTVVASSEGTSLSLAQIGLFPVTEI